MFDRVMPYAHLFCGLDALQMPIGENALITYIEDFENVIDSDITFEGQE